MNKTLVDKLGILADAAKYDASCASSGAPKRAAGKNGLGSTSNGICHAYTPDGRCISLLKILLTNYCLFDCAYCINRRSSNVARARFSVDEVVALTLNFYKRNYIEGLFLSSGIARSPDRTMEEMMLVAKELRQEHGFAGYIHLKTIPEANPWLIEQAGLFADRLSINLELPDRVSLKRLAPEKDGANIAGAGWPSCGEVDILEWLSTEPTWMKSALHWYHGGQADWGTGESGGYNLADSFHTYEAEWSASSIIFRLDGVHVGTTFYHNEPAFQQPHYLILNLALGGNFYGNPGAGSVDLPWGVTKSMDIDRKSVV